MKYTITVAGDITSGLTHFALAGLSLLGRALTDRRVVTYWSQDANPRATLEMEDVTPVQLAESIQKICQKWSNGWASVQVNYAAGTFSPFSPRFKSIDSSKHPEDWLKHQTSRNQEFDTLVREHDFLALQFIQSLGEAAYWCFNKKKPSPDSGASRWEMKTRNHGQEFISDKLLKFSQVLSTWPGEKILSGITGEQTDDPWGKVDSRTPSGFTPPNPTDLALAFVALLGIGQFPLTQRISDIAITPGAFPDSRIHPKVAVVPVHTSAISPERFESAVMSREWNEVVRYIGALDTGRQNTEAKIAEAIAYLQNFSIEAAISFPIQVIGSVNAPERYFCQGRIHLL